MVCIGRSECRKNASSVLLRLSLRGAFKMRNVQKGQHDALDLVFAGAIGSNPHGVVGAFCVLELDLLGLNVADHVQHPLFQLVNVHLHPEVADGAANVHGGQPQQLLGLYREASHAEVRPSITIGIFTLLSRFVRSLLSCESCMLRCCISSLTVFSSSLADSSSSFDVWSSSLVLCSSSLPDWISSLADCSSSLVASRSSIIDCKYSFVPANSCLSCSIWRSFIFSLCGLSAVSRAGAGCELGPVSEKTIRKFCSELPPILNGVISMFTSRRPPSLSTCTLSRLTIAFPLRADSRVFCSSDRRPGRAIRKRFRLAFPGESSR